MDKVEQRFRESGSRLTHKRKLALSLLLKSRKALSAYELVDAYRAEQGNTIPATSMYRILDFLITEHLVHRLELTNKYIACEQIGCKHDHEETQFLICSQCQKVKEIRIDGAIMKDLKNNIRTAGFHFSSPQLEMYCICEDCKKKPTQ